MFYRFLKRHTDIDIPVDTGDFRLIDKKVAEVFLTLKEKNKFIRGLISWVGFKQTHIEYIRDKRHSGKTKYSFSKMVSFALDGITGFSAFPLKVATYLGMMGVVFGFFLFVYSMFSYFFVKNTLSGWTSLMLTSIFLGSIQLLSLGVIGEYIRRIYDEVKNRPNYVIDVIKQKKGSKKDSFSKRIFTD